jgi:hypothetical protein
MKNNLPHRQWPRSEVLNEKYYEQSNVPTFNQFKGKYHFHDSLNRQYMIAVKNNETFQNENTQFKPRNMKKKKDKTKNRPYQCIKNSLGHIKFFVKLPSSNIKWFGTNDINKSILLTPIKKRGALTDNIDKTFTIILKSTDKSLVKKATGSIYVKGIDMNVCNEIINQ